MKQNNGLLKFQNLPEEKQELILNVALEEFANHGYELASTNRIVEKAQISKGVLFKYFTSKEHLFIYILEKKLDEKIKWMNTHSESLPSDFFEILRWYTLREMEFIKREAVFYKAFLHVTNQPDHPIHKKVMLQSQTSSADIVRNLVNRLPSSNLRKEVSIQQAFQFISWVFEGFKKQYMVSLDSPTWEEEALSEVERIFDMIKYGIYKG